MKKLLLSVLVPLLMLLSPERAAAQAAWFGLQPDVASMHATTNFFIVVMGYGSNSVVRKTSPQEALAILQSLPGWAETNCSPQFAISSDKKFYVKDGANMTNLIPYFGGSGNPYRAPVWTNADTAIPSVRSVWMHTNGAAIITLAKDAPFGSTTLPPGIYYGGYGLATNGDFLFHEFLITEVGSGNVGGRFTMNFDDVEHWDFFQNALVNIAGTQIISNSAMSAFDLYFGDNLATNNQRGSYIVMNPANNVVIQKSVTLNSSLLMPIPGSVLSLKGTSLQMITNTTFSLGKDLNDGTVNKMMISSNSYLVANGNSDSAEIDRYRLSNTSVGWHSNDIVRRWELTNAIALLGGGGGASTNSSQFGAAGSTLTLRDGVTITNANQIGTLQITNAPGAGSGVMRIWQTNGVRYSELTIPDNLFSTNRIILSIGSNTVSATQVLKVHSTSISGGVNTITLTNDADGLGGGSISTNASQFGAAGSTLTLRDGVTVTNLNASGTIQATNVPGQAPGTLRLWQTNGIRYTELTIPDNYFATNKIVLSIGSNTVAAAQVLKVHSTSISGGVNTITLTNDTGGSAGGGGTNFPPVVLGTGTALTNVTTGVGVRQSITLLTSSNQYLNFQTDALNGETVTVAVTNMGATNVQIILQTNQVTSVFYDPTVASNRNSFTVAANAVAVNTFVHSTNFGNNWILYNTLGKEMELQVAGLGLSLLTNSSKDTLTITNTQSASLGITIDGGGSAITTGTKGYIEVPYNCVIERVTMLADQSGSAVVDLWKTNYANYPPTVGATITASAKPTITTATKSQTSTLTGWVTNVTAGDIIGFNVDSASTITRLTLQLKVNR